MFFPDSRQRAGAWSLSWRLALFLFVPFLACVVGMGVLLDRWLNDWLEERMQEEVELIARSLKRPLGYSIERGRVGTVQESLDAAFDFGRVYGAYLYDTEGTLLAQAGAFGEDRDFRSRHFNLTQDSAPGGGYEEMGGRRLFSYFVPVQDRNGVPVGLLQVARSHEDMTERLLAGKQTAWLFLLGGTFLLAAVILLGYYFGVGRALAGLGESMERVRRGKRSHRAVPQGPRELRSLALAFNGMLDSIDAAESELVNRRANEQSLRQRLKRSERLAFLGKMAGGLAHEIGTPLSTIDGKAQHGLRRLPKDSSAHRLFAEVRSEVARISEIVRQLLLFGQDGRQSGMREVAVEDLMASAVRTAIQTSQPLEAEITTSCRPKGLCLPVNPLRTELALKNLVQNAIEATPGGRVKVECQFCGEEAHLAVEDNGPGLDKDVHVEVFEPFWRGEGRNPNSGSGLGLALVQQVAMEQGGRVDVRASSMGGCRFTMILPCHGFSGTVTCETNQLVHSSLNSDAHD